MDSATASPEPESRRRSGRVVKAPTKYAPEPTAAAPKRKRNDDEAEDDGEVENGDVASDEDMSDAASDAESDHDHPAPKPRKAQTSRAKKPSTKKPKINGSRPAATGAIARIPSRPKKTVRIDPGEKGTGLFGMSPFHLYSLPLPCPLYMGLALTYLFRSRHLRIWRFSPICCPAMARKVQGERCGCTWRSDQLYPTMRGLRSGSDS